jgi:hypothetical protein
MDTIDNTLAPKMLIAKLDQSSGMPATGSTALSLWSLLGTTDKAALAGVGILQVEVVSPTVAWAIQTTAANGSAQWLVAAGFQERIPLTGSTDTTLNSTYAVSQTAGAITTAVARIFYRAAS